MWAQCLVSGLISLYAYIKSGKLLRYCFDALLLLYLAGGVFLFNAYTHTELGIKQEKYMAIAYALLFAKINVGLVD